MKYQILFAWKNKKNVINLLLVKLAQKLLQVKGYPMYMYGQWKPKSSPLEVQSNQVLYYLCIKISDRYSMILQAEILGRLI